MALIPPHYFDAVVALGKANDEGKASFTASGFLYGYPGDVDPEDGQRWYRIFLVTNRHVFEGENNLVVRINRREKQPSKVFPLLLRSADGSVHWTTHPGGADIAIVPVSTKTLSKHGIELRAFQQDRTTVSRDEARDVGISEGDGVFVLGFPLGLAGEERNYAIARHGILARVQDWLHGDSDQFLIDAPVFPGNSGGPVVTKPEAISIKGTRSIEKSCLIGIVTGFLPYEDIAVSKQTGKPRVVFQENSGLAVVVPADVIQETIEIALGKT